MKKAGLPLMSLALSTALWAEGLEKKGLDVINRSTAEARTGSLADDDPEGREAGFRGGRIAGDYTVANLKPLGIDPVGDSYYHPFEAYHMECQKRGARWQAQPDSTAAIKQAGVSQKPSSNNILGKVEGKNPSEIVIVGAHCDHLGIDPMLDGDQVYNRADDNASGVSTVLQIVRAFFATGQQPERTVMFAFQGGEEKGLLGSKASVQSFPEIKNMKGYLNFDTIGHNNNETKSIYVVYLYTEAYPVFDDWLENDIKKYNLNLAPDCRPQGNPVGGSDNGSFAKIGISIIWYHTDGHLDYHQSSGHVDWVNWDRMVNITKASPFNMQYMMNEKDFQRLYVSFNRRCLIKVS